MIRWQKYVGLFTVSYGWGSDGWWEDGGIEDMEDVWWVWENEVVEEILRSKQGQVVGYSNILFVFNWQLISVHQSLRSIFDQYTKSEKNIKIKCNFFLCFKIILSKNENAKS